MNSESRKSKFVHKIPLNISFYCLYSEPHVVIWPSLNLVLGQILSFLCLCLYSISVFHIISVNNSRPVKDKWLPTKDMEKKSPQVSYNLTNIYKTIRFIMLTIDIVATSYNDLIIDAGGGTNVYITLHNKEYTRH